MSASTLVKTVMLVTVYFIYRNNQKMEKARAQAKKASRPMYYDYPQFYFN